MSETDSKNTEPSDNPVYPELAGQSAGASSPQPYRTFDENAIVDIFSYHPPTEEQRKNYEEINEAFIHLATEIEPLIPDGPGKETAFRKLKEASMAVNSAISLEGKF